MACTNPTATPMFGCCGGGTIESCPALFRMSMMFQMLFWKNAGTFWRSITTSTGLHTVNQYDPAGPNDAGVCKPVNPLFASQDNIGSAASPPGNGVILAFSNPITLAEMMEWTRDTVLNESFDNWRYHPTQGWDVLLGTQAGAGSRTISKTGIGGWTPGSSQPVGDFVATIQIVVPDCYGAMHHWFEPSVSPGGGGLPLPNRRAVIATAKLRLFEHGEAQFPGGTQEYFVSRTAYPPATFGGPFDCAPAVIVSDPIKTGRYVDIIPPTFIGFKAVNFSSEDRCNLAP